MAKFINAILAGVMIGIGATAYLSCDNKYIGAMLFTVGLFAICVFGLELYTGKVGYIPLHRPKYIAEVALAAGGNIVGCFLASLALRTDKLHTTVIALCDAKLAQPYYRLFLLAVMCGILMYIAVHSYKVQEGFSKFVGIFLCIPTFILCGFEHSIADTFYLCLAGVFTPQALMVLILTLLGNAAGGMLIPAAQLLTRQTTAEQTCLSKKDGKKRDLEL